MPLRTVYLDRKPVRGGQPLLDHFAQQRPRGAKCSSPPARVNCTTLRAGYRVGAQQSSGWHDAGAFDPAERRGHSLNPGGYQDEQWSAFRDIAQSEGSARVAAAEYTGIPAVQQQCADTVPRGQGPVERHVDPAGQTLPATYLTQPMSNSRRAEPMLERLAARHQSVLCVDELAQGLGFMFHRSTVLSRAYRGQRVGERLWTPSAAAGRLGTVSGVLRRRRPCVINAM